MKIYVFSYEYFPNCPRHDAGIYSGLKRVANEDELLRFALVNLNENHILDVLLLNDNDELEFIYIPETHKYYGIEYYKNNNLIKRTVDNGSGILIWKDV